MMPSNRAIKLLFNQLKIVKIKLLMFTPTTLFNQLTKNQPLKLNHSSPPLQTQMTSYRNNPPKSV